MRLVAALPCHDLYLTGWAAQGCNGTVERGIEIISEASRRLPEDLKARHPEIPWPKVAGIGNVLRHDYEDVAAPVMWKLVHDDLPALEAVCRGELAAAEAAEE
jgi:uncharacterized protein with HEPN domain